MGAGGGGAGRAGLLYGEGEERERKVTPFGENAESIGTNLLECLERLGKMVLIQ